jgi:hypothetical protein
VRGDARRHVAAEWPVIDFDDWPELARPAAAWAMGALADLEEYDPHTPVSLQDAAGAITPGWPVAAAKHGEFDRP